MKTLIIYDNEGTIIDKKTGFYKVPVGIPYIEIEIPQGKYPISIDIETSEPIFEDIPKSEIEILESKISILEKENKKLKEVTKEQDNLLVDNAYKITMLQMNLGGK